jgi:ABC-type glycerol-3-phosphate transport system substrate-binding protein
MIKKFILIFLVLTIISTFIVGCQYVVQLPEKDVGKIERAVGSSIAIYNELKERALEGNILNIVVTNDVEALTAGQISSEFESQFNININIVQADWKKVIELLDLETTVLPGENTGEVIDIIIYPSYYIGEIERSIYNLRNYIERDNYDINDFLPGIFDLVGKWKDKIKGIPIHTSIYSLIFPSENIRSDELLTYEKYNNYLEVIKTTGKYDNAVIFDSSELNILWSNRFWSLGGKIKNENWDITLDNEFGFESLGMLKIMAQYFPREVFNKSYEDIINLFLSERVAIFEGKADFLIYNETQSALNKCDLTVLPVPSSEAGNYSQIRAKNVSILKTSKNKEMAWEWIKIYTSVEKGKIFLEKFGLLEPRVSIYEDKNLNSKYIYLKDIYNLYKNSDIRTIYNFKGAFEAWEIMLNNTLYNALLEDRSTKNTLKEIEEEWKSIILHKRPPADIEYDG